MNKVLVTGGTGFIGSHTVVELVEQGFEVLVIDNLSNSTIQVIDRIERISEKKITFIEGDVCDVPLIKQIQIDHPEIIAIIHFAAYKAVGESVEFPLKYYRNNIDSLLTLLEIFGNNQIHLVFSSSCTVYGEPDTVPVSESAPIKKAISPYGNTKQIAEEILYDFSSRGALNISCLRYFNPVGAHPSALIGELPLGVPNNLVPYITQTAAGWRKELKVFGNDYNTPDGTCIRDYIHVVDLAKAHVAALLRMINKKNESKMEVFNIGTGKGLSVLEIIHSFERVNNIQLNYSFAPRRAGDVERVFGDVRLAQEKLQWKAQFGVDEMMEHSWKWQQTLTKPTE